MFATGKSNVLEALVLKTGKKGYKCFVPGKTPFTGTKTSLNVGTYVNTFNNEFAIVILDNGPETSESIIDGLANGTFVVVYENKHKGTTKDAAFQVSGEETEGGWKAVLTEERAPKSGLFLHKTDYETTKALFDSLIAAA